MCLFQRAQEFFSLTKYYCYMIQGLDRNLKVYQNLASSQMKNGVCFPQLCFKYLQHYTLQLSGFDSHAYHKHSQFVQELSRDVRQMSLTQILPCIFIYHQFIYFSLLLCCILDDQLIKFGDENLAEEDQAFQINQTPSFVYSPSLCNKYSQIKSEEFQSECLCFLLHNYGCRENLPRERKIFSLAARLILFSMSIALLLYRMLTKF